MRAACVILLVLIALSGVSAQDSLWAAVQRYWGSSCYSSDYYSSYSSACSSDYESDEPYGPPPPPPTAPSTTCLLHNIEFYSESARYYLQGVSGYVYVCAEPANSNCKEVEFTVNGKYYAKSSDGCIWYNPGHSSSAQLLRATGINWKGQRGVSEESYVPIYTLPTWFLRIFGNPSRSLFGSSDDWGYSRSIEVITPFKASVPVSLPFLKGSGSVAIAAAAAFKVSDSGEAEAEGKGGIEISVADRASKIVGVVNSNFGVRYLGSGLYAPQLNTLKVGLEGEVQLPTPWSWPLILNVPIINKKVGASITFSIVISSSMSLTFGFSEYSSPLPIAFQSVSGRIGGGGIIKGKVSLFDSAEISGKFVFSPMLSYVRGKGFQFNGFYVEIDVEVELLVQGKKIVLNPISLEGACNSGGCDISKRFVALREPQISTIVNVWAPTVASRSPLTITNTLPTGSVIVASIGSVDMLTFISFNSNNQQQIAYSHREKQGQWSDLAFVPSASGIVDFPALAGVTSSNSFLLVASLKTGADASNAAHLIFSKFDVASSSWSPYKDLLPETPVNALDFAPVVSQDGFMVAFVRITDSGEEQLMSSSWFGRDEWSAPLLVTLNDASSFSFDRSSTGSALLAFDDEDANLLTICTLPNLANSWTCKATAFEADTKISVLAVGNNFLVVYGDDSSISVTVYDENGNLIRDSYIDTDENLRLTAAQSNLGDGSIVIGWESLTTTSNKFHYALVEASGTIHYSPSLFFDHVRPTSDVWRPMATSLDSNGDKLVFASMLRDGSQIGQLTVVDLDFTPAPTLSDITFTPADFNASSVTIQAKITNDGLIPLNANGGGSLVFAFGSGSSPVAFASAPVSMLNTGESESLTAVWPLNAVRASGGGKLSISYSGADNTAAAPVFIDPCQLHVGAPSLITLPTGTIVRFGFKATGVCNTNIALTASTTDGLSESVVLGSSSVVVTPDFHQVLDITVTNVPSELLSSLSVVAVGDNRQAKGTSKITSENYDFALVPSMFAVTSPERGNVVVQLTVANSGKSAATKVPIDAILISSEGKTSVLASMSVDLAAFESHKQVTLTLPLKAALNNVRFVINDPQDQTYPEVFVEDNLFNTNVAVKDGDESGSYVNPDNNKELPTGVVVGVCVAVGVVVLVVAVASVIIIRRLRGAPAPAGYSLMDQK